MRVRGLVSIMLVLLFVFPLMEVVELEKAAAEKTRFFEAKTLVLEKRYYVEMDLKHAARQALENAGGSTRKETVLNAARNLALLEEFFEDKYAAQGIFADFWLGAPDEEEVARLTRGMLQETRAKKCGECWDLQAQALDWDNETVPLAIAFLDAEGGRAWVSRNGLAFVQGFDAREAGFGASLFFPAHGVSAVVLIPEGFNE